MGPDTILKPEPWVIEPLSSHHDREAFDCGVEEMNAYLKRHASQNARRDISRTFVAVPAAQGTYIAGYYTLSMSSVTFEELPKEKHLPRYPVPVAHLGRLAVDLNSRGRRLGEYLLFHALYRVLRVSDEIGVYGVEVRALDADVSRFYSKYGFQPMADDPLRLYMTMKSIRALGLV